MASPTHYSLSTGLSSAAAEALLKSEGYNELPAAERRGVLRILWEVVRQPMFALLIGGGIVYLLLGDRLEALLLIAFAGLSVSITIVQESRSERVLDALRNLASPRATVIRDGRRVQIAGREVVPGDLLVIAEGDRVAADARLISAMDLLVDESLLTGESVPVRKRAADPSAPTPDSIAPPGGEDLPWIFGGTLVVRGGGIACVRSTGKRSEMGKIGHALGGIETEQPRLQLQIRWLIRDFAIVGAIAGTLTVVLFGLLRGPWLQALLGGIALGMSLLPEEFPLVMAVFMAMGAWRISRARVLTRRASAIETLGATTVLCTDKTGTLTENRMTLIAIVGGDCAWSAPADMPLPTESTRILQAGLLACAREATDPMDVAIHTLAKSQSLTYPGADCARHLLHSYGLRPDLFVVANVFSGEAGRTATAYAKGALEAIAALCRLGPERVAAIRAQVDGLARNGIRVLGVAQSPPAGIDAAAPFPDSPRGYEFEYLGLIGFTDPLRANVPGAVAECNSAGIRVVMITGDYPATAGAIGREAGLGTDSVMTGEEVESLPAAQFAQRVRTTSIFARIRPNQKLKVVQQLKANGEVVAMTGDGVNDAPAIKAAHIGIAMGGRGTEVAREASAIVLLDDDFGSIVTTIRLGRRIYDNLRKAIEYIVAVHIPIAGLALLPLLLGLPLMLTPIHIAFLEMIIDPACSLVFEAEGEEEDVMRRPPRDPSSPLLLRHRVIWAVLQGLIVLAVLGAMLVIASRAGTPEANLRTLVFTSLVFLNMGLILVNRSFKSSLKAALLRPNRSLWILLGGVCVLLTIAVTWPPARLLFHFEPMNWAGFGACALSAGASIMVLEALKAFWFRRASTVVANTP